MDIATTTTTTKQNVDPVRLYDLAGKNGLLSGIKLKWFFLAFYVMSTTF
jgi:hypothetical protein